MEKGPPSNPNSFPVRFCRSHVPLVVENWAPQGLFFQLSKELHSDSEMEVPLCTLSPFRRHPLGVYTWDLLRFSTYQQHPKPNCFASCRVLTPAGHCDSSCLFWKVKHSGNRSWRLFPERFLDRFWWLFHVSSQGQPGCSKEPNGISLITPSRVHLRAAATRENTQRQCPAAAEGASKTHTQSVHAWPSTDLHRQHSAYAPAFKPHQLCGLKAREPSLRGMLGLRPR